jgi:hypothetical protein
MAFFDNNLFVGFKLSKFELVANLKDFVFRFLWNFC